MSIPKLSQPNHIHLNQICQLTCQGLYSPFCYPPSLWCPSSCLSQEEWRLRPIAVGEVLRRLTSKCLSFAVRSAAFAHLAPLQLGVNVKGSCEAVIHSVSQLMSSGQPDQQRVLLLDFTNAFNTINRFSMFEEFRAHIPGLSAWMESCYSGQPFLHLGSQTTHVLSWATMFRLHPPSHSGTHQSCSSKPHPECVVFGWWHFGWLLS